MIDPENAPHDQDDDADDSESTTPAFEIDLDPEDQGTAEAGAEPSG